MASKAVLFDLDGVITATSELHYIAWKEMAESIGIKIDREFNEQLKGVDRRTSINRILSQGNQKLEEDQILRLMDEKNERYKQLLETITGDDVLPGILELLAQLRTNGIKVSLASASKNAPLILDKLELTNYFDYIANPSMAKESKPAPDIFLLAAQGVGVDISKCIGIEDAEAGLQAIKSAGAKSVTIGLTEVEADLVLRSTSDLEYKKIMSLFNS